MCSRFLLSFLFRLILPYFCFCLSIRIRRSIGEIRSNLVFLRCCRTLKHTLSKTNNGKNVLIVPLRCIESAVIKRFHKRIYRSLDFNIIYNKYSIQWKRHFQTVTLRSFQDMTFVLGTKKGRMRGQKLHSLLGHIRISLFGLWPNRFRLGMNWKDLPPFAKMKLIKSNPTLLDPLETSPSTFPSWYYVVAFCLVST